jgi:glycosyltransferase involved in cell wall biosynthesis
MGHDVCLICQEPRPDRFDLGARVRVVRPDIGPLLPVFVLDRYEGVEARHVADFTAAELDRYTAANAGAIAVELDAAPVDLVLANHALMGGPVAAAACGERTRFAVKVHGSELEYAIRGRPALAEAARDSLAGAAAVFAGSEHIVAVTEELLGEGAYRRALRIVPPGVDTDGFAPGRGSLPALLRLLDAGSGRASPGVPAERAADADAAASLAGLGRFVLYFGKLMRQKGVHLLLDAWRDVAPHHPGTGLVIVGFGDARAELEAGAPPSVIFTGAMDHEQLQLLVPLAEAVVVPSVLPEAFGMVAAEAAACAVVPIVADHSGLAEVAAGLGEAGITFDGTAADLAARLHALLALPEPERARLGALAREAVVARWSWEGIARRLIADAIG